MGRLRGILTVGVAPTRLDSTHLSSGSTTLLGRFLPVEMGFRKDKMDHYFDIYFNNDNNDYLSRHPEIERFDMPKTFYFRYLPDRLEIHWAIIKPADGYVNVYFINNIGRVFDKLEFKNIKIARRRLRKCGFDYSTNKCCKETPREPIYVQLSEGKKSAPYSKGNLFQSVQRSTHDKAKKSYYKGLATLMSNQKKRYKEKEKTKPRKYTAFGVTGGFSIMLWITIVILITRPVFWLSLRDFIEYIKNHLGG